MILDKLRVLEESTNQRKEPPAAHGEGTVNEELQRRLDELTLMKLRELERLHAHQTQTVSLREFKNYSLSFLWK